MNILVIGKAKTGTTVISKTLQKSIGENVGYFLEPKRIEFFQDASKFENEGGNVVKIIFEHWNAAPRFRNGLIHNESELKFDKVVCIVRDPRDEMLSRMLYVIKPYIDAKGMDELRVQQWITILEEKENDPASISFFELVQKFDELFSTDTKFGFLVATHVNQYNTFLRNIRDRVFVIKYEDFIDGRLMHLESYLGFKLVDDRDVGNLSRTRRSASYGGWRDFFSPSDVDQLLPILGESLKLMGYDNWDLNKVGSLNSTHFSQYVKRIAFS